MLTETLLTEEKEATRLIEGYNLHASHRDTKRIGGDVAIFTHQSLNTKTEYKKTTTRYSTVWVKVSDKKGHLVIYGCVYHPKSKHNSETGDILRHISETMVNLASNHSKKFVIGGDFNQLYMTDIELIFDLQNMVNFST